MREFLVEITTTVPEGTSQDEVDRRRAAEAARARELAATGNLARLWRPVGEPRSIGVWRATDEAELHEKVLDTLPLRPWMTLTVTPLESHPNDPGRTSGTGHRKAPGTASWPRARGRHLGYRGDPARSRVRPGALCGEPAAQPSRGTAGDRDYSTAADAVGGRAASTGR